MSALAEGGEVLRHLLADMLWKVGIVGVLAVVAVVAIVIIYRMIGRK